MIEIGEKSIFLFKKKKRLKANLGTGIGLEELRLGDKDGPGLAGFAEHLLGLEHLALVENRRSDVLGGGGGGVEDLLDAVDEGDRDLGRVVVGPSLHLQLARRV